MIGSGGVQEELPSLPILLYIANEASFSPDSVGVIEDTEHDLAVGGNHARKNGGVIKYGQKKGAVGTELGSTEVEMVEYGRASFLRQDREDPQKRTAPTAIFIALDLTSRTKSNPINPEHLSTRECNLLRNLLIPAWYKRSVRFISANERLRMHQVRGGCVCMRRGSFWARSVILVQTITDKTRLIYPSGCGKFRDDSYEEACKSRDILGNGWILAEFVFQRRSTLRWSFDHRLRVFASTPITVLKSARILADFSRLRPPRGIGFLDINRLSNEIYPRYHGTHILHSDTLVDVHDDFTLLTSYRTSIYQKQQRGFSRREDEIASTCGDAVAGSRARGMKHRVAPWDRASSACLVFCRAVPCFLSRFRFYEASAQLVTQAATSTRPTKARVVTRGRLTGNVSLNDKSNVDCCAAAEYRGTMRFQFYYASCGR
ncbi:hypothetical protein ALC57_14417 [Trachymyrmex cornetzi]|uniref:Uncharacterized protein n=1 Tax=Trachymyrmex cornetzi TaxID=471704 RepID=A0A195DLN7_9HYME|nr:hypothetical protein ALC57_14417 [Trachymyrmex cornetzi]